MKKRLFIFVALVFGLFLAACTPSTPKDPPTFHGLDAVQINVGDTFEPKAGVTAKDYTGKDITANIVVTGAVDVNTPGVYELTYTVKDSGNRQTTKTRLVTVVDPGTAFESLAGLVNGNFADGLNGWTTWVNETQDVEAEIDVVDGEAVIDVIAQSIVKDNNWWDIQLKQGITFDKLESLKLVFTARAENPRKMMVVVEGGGMPEKAIHDHLVDLTTEDQTFEIEFFSKTNAVDASLMFALGTLHKEPGVPEADHVVLGKVYISNVHIVEGPVLENQAPTITASNVLLRVGHEGFLIKQGVVVDDDRDTLTLEDVTATDITDGDKLTSPAKKGVYTIQYSVTDSGGLTTTITRLVVVANPFEVPGFAEVGDDGVPLGWSVWFEDTRGGLEVSAENEVVTIDITKIGLPDDLGNVWENKFILGGLAPFEGTYTLSFKAKADLARPLVYAMEGDGGVGIAAVKEIVDLTDEWQLFTYTFEIAKDGIYDNRRLEFWFGNMADEEGYSAADNVLTKVYIKEVMIGDLTLAPDLGGVVNGDFSNGLIGWTTWANDTQGVAADFSVVDGEAIVDVTEQAMGAENNWWDIQIKQTKINFDAYQSLKLVFTARAENARKMMVVIQGGGMPEKAIHDHLVDLTTEDQTFEIEFYSKTDAINAELMFALGTLHREPGVPEAEHVVLGKVYLSDVKIVAGPTLENQAPVLTIDNALIKPGTEEFDLKAGIVVDDDFDFLDADDVVITDVSDVKFALPAVAGVYKFTYSVTDSGNLTTTVERFIVVKDPFDVPGFADVDDDGVPLGWVVWFEENRGGLEVSAENEVVTIDIKKIGVPGELGNIWENQFKVTNLAPFAGTYTLSFKAKADLARPLVYAMEGHGGAGLENVKKAVDLTDEWQIFTYTFEVTKDGIYDNRSLQFWFGNMADEDGYSADDNILTKVYLRDVVIGDFSLAPDLGGVVNGDFSNDLLGWTTWANDTQGVAADFSVVDGEAVVDVTAQAMGAENNWWDIQIKQTKINFDAYQSLKLVFTARAENARKMMVVIQGGGMPEKAIHDHLVDLTTEDQTFEIEFYSKTDAINAELMFALGTLHREPGVPEAEHVVLGKVYLSDVKIVAGPTLENQAPVLTIDNALIKPGTEEFDLKAGIVVDDDFDFLDADDVVITDLSDVEFALPAVAGVYKFKYSVTDSGGLTTEIERFVVVKDPFVIPPLANPDANGVPEGWELWHEDTRGGLEAETVDGVTKLTITKVGVEGDLGNIWENQFKVMNLAAYEGIYVLYFSAKADLARPMVIAMEGNGGVGIPNVSFVKDLTDEYQEFAIRFVIEKDAIYDNRNLQFWFGNMANIEGYSAADNVLTNVYLKDVRIEPAEYDAAKTIDFIAMEAPVNNDNKVEATVEYIDGSAVVTYLGVQEWYASASKLKYAGIHLDPKISYKVILEVKAETARDIMVYFVGLNKQPISVEFNQVGGKMLLPLPEDFVTYELIFTPEVAGPYDLEIHFGWEDFLRNSSAANVITFKQIKLIPEKSLVDPILDAAIVYNLYPLDGTGAPAQSEAYWNEVFEHELFNYTTKAEKLYDGNASGGRLYANTPGMIKMGTSGVNGELTLRYKEEVKIKTVVLYIEGWQAGDKVSVNGEEVALVNTQKFGYRVEFVLPVETNVIEIKTMKRAFLFTVELYGPDATVRVPENVTVSFNYNDDETATVEKVIEKGRKVMQVADPTRTGYTFKGWYVDLNDAKPFDFTEQIFADLSLKAKWEVIFDFDRAIDFIAMEVSVDNDGDPKSNAVYNEDGSVDINYMGAAWWASHAKLKYTGLDLDPALQYKFLVEVKAESARDIMVYFVGAGGNPVAPVFNMVSKKMVMPIPDEYVTYELVFQPAVAGPYDLEIQFGWEDFLTNAAAANVITFKKILLAPEKPLSYVDDAAIVYDFYPLTGNGAPAQVPAYWDNILDHQLFNYVSKAEKLYDGNAASGRLYAHTPGMIKMGTGSANGELTIRMNENVLIKTVVLYIEGWQAGDKVSVNGEEVDLVITQEFGNRVVFTLPVSTNIIEIKTMRRAFLFTIELYGPEATIRVPEDVTVTFDLNYDGSTAVDKVVEKGRKTTAIADPEREGYTFKGWYVDVEDADPFAFYTTIIDSNLTLKAKWEAAS